MLGICIGCRVVDYHHSIYELASYANDPCALDQCNNEERPWQALGVISRGGEVICVIGEVN